MKKKKNIRGKISGYHELIAIKKELRKSIAEQEEYFNNDLFKIDNIYKSAVKFILSRKKGKETVLNNSNTLILTDLIIGALGPYTKTSKQKQILLPPVSLAISYAIISLLNYGFRKKQSS